MVKSTTNNYVLRISRGKFTYTSYNCRTRHVILYFRSLLRNILFSIQIKQLTNYHTYWDYVQQFQCWIKTFLSLSLNTIIFNLNWGCPNPTHRSTKWCLLLWRVLLPTNGKLHYERHTRKMTDFDYSCWNIIANRRSAFKNYSLYVKCMRNTPTIRV